ncbi:MAG: MarR family transcriptional regulator, partial [Planctomycetota bacterium]
MVRTTRRSPSQSPEPASHRWTFLSNHAHVLICLAQEDSPRLRDIAGRIGITERAVGAIVHDLEEGGFLKRGREGRR